MDNETKQTLCPTCGAKISGNATRCTVCGRVLSAFGSKSEKAVKTPRLPELTLNLPVAIGLFLVVLAIGAGLTYILLQSSGKVAEPTPTMTATTTPTITATATEVATSTPEPTLTLQPPRSYTIVEQDTCGYIAAIYDVSVKSIADLNGLPSDCGTLIVGTTLLIPWPTATPKPQPTVTLGSSQATEAACPKDYYKVQPGDTLGGIAKAYNVDSMAIREWNGLPSDTVYEDMTLIIPLCARLPTPGPTPTPTTPPPYPAPNLLLPVDGAPFTAADDSVTLQWAAVGTLRQNEAYAVSVEDITEGGSKKMVVYVTETSYNVTASFRPTGTTPHAIRWTVQPVRQTGTNSQGNPIWESAGVVSTPRVFVWSGAAAASTLTP